MPVLALSSLIGNITSEDIQFYLLLIPVLCISLSFHEAAHGWVAYRLGDDTAALQGRLTLNPLKHLDPVGTIVFLIAKIGWAKPVPINPARFDRRHSIKKGLMLVSIAGPGSNFLLAILATVVYFLIVTIALLTGAQNRFVDILLQLFYMMYFYNVVLAVFNLLPVPPLDGFKIFGVLLPDRVYYRLMNYERYIGFIFLFLVIFARGTLGRILQTIRIPFDYIILEPIRFIFVALWRALGLY